MIRGPFTFCHEALNQTMIDEMITNNRRSRHESYRTVLCCRFLWVRRSLRDMVARALKCSKGERGGTKVGTHGRAASKACYYGLLVSLLQPARAFQLRHAPDGDAVAAGSEEGAATLRSGCITLVAERICPGNMMQVPISGGTPVIIPSILMFILGVVLV